MEKKKDLLRDNIYQLEELIFLMRDKNNFFELNLKKISEFIIMFHKFEN